MDTSIIMEKSYFAFVYIHIPTYALSVLLKQKSCFVVSADNTYIYIYIYI